MMFQQGGNAVDAACAMLARHRDDVGRAGLGRRDAGADLQPAHEEGDRRSTRSASRRPARRRSSSRAQGHATTRRSTGRSPRSRRARPAACMTMLAEFGTLSLAEVLAPAIEMADGYPIERADRDAIERSKARDQAVAVLEARSSCRTRARRARRRDAGRDLPPARPRRDAAQARRGRAQALAGGQEPQGRDPWPPTTASTAATSPQEFVRGVAASRAG